MARAIQEEIVTKKIEPLPRPNFHARLIDQLERALPEAEEVGQDIRDAILKLIASTRRRQIEAMPDITKEAEAA